VSAHGQGVNTPKRSSSLVEARLSAMTVSASLQALPRPSESRPLPLYKVLDTPSGACKRVKTREYEPRAPGSEPPTKEFS
jgi:hypothetical protein